MTILTMGHSVHTPQVFVAMARAARVEVIVDVRSHRTSKWPWFHEAEFRQFVTDAGLDYIAEPRLGGWDAQHADHRDWALQRGVKLGAYVEGYFPKQRIGAHVKDPLTPGQDHLPLTVPGAIPDRFRSMWTSQGLHDYAWFTVNPSGDFLAGLRDLLDTYGRNTDPNCAIICAECQWWKCHRSMIADAAEHVIETPGSTYADRTIPMNIMPAPIKADPGRVRITRHGPINTDDPTCRLKRYPADVIAGWETVALPAPAPAQRAS